MAQRSPETSIIDVPDKASEEQPPSEMQQHEQAALEAAQRQEIQTLWGRYNFPGNPPPEGSVAEGRMLKIAEDYVESALGVTANKQTASDVVRHASELNQRELHNQLSIMIYGVGRSQMSAGDSRACQVSDFAAGIAFPGDTLDSIRSRMKQRPVEG
jgi:hypothetical protein